jgi:hypothetical protein
MLIEQHTNLFLDPRSPRADQPVIDLATKKMTAALRGSKQAGQYTDGEFILHKRNFGTYFCSCGACVASCDFLLPNGFVATPLAVHYLAYHRQDIPQDLLAQISSFDYGLAVPTPAELL